MAYDASATPLRRIFPQFLAMIVQFYGTAQAAAAIIAAPATCLHDVRIILRFPCNACTIQQLSCFHLTAALQASCDNFFFFLYFKFGSTVPAVL